MISTVLAILGVLYLLVFGDHVLLNVVWWAASLIGLVVPAQLTWKSLKKKTLTINTLLTVATISSLLIGLYEEAVILVIVFSIGEILESVLVQMMERELTVLKQLIPSTATIVRDDGETEEISTDDIKMGQRFQVNSGDLVPVDGTNTAATIEVQKSHLTGESEPEVITTGDTIFAGSLIIRGSTVIRSEVNAGESHVHDIVRSVEDSLGRKSSAERFSTKFGKVYTPAIAIENAEIQGIRVSIFV